MATSAIIFVFVLFWTVILYGAFKVGNYHSGDKE